jgi:hypothetical protein
MSPECVVGYFLGGRFFFTWADVFCWKTKCHLDGDMFSASANPFSKADVVWIVGHAPPDGRIFLARPEIPGMAMAACSSGLGNPC